MTVYLRDTNTISYLFDVQSPLHRDIPGSFREQGTFGNSISPEWTTC